MKRIVFFYILFSCGCVPQKKEQVPEFLLSTHYENVKSKFENTSINSFEKRKFLKVIDKIDKIESEADILELLKDENEYFTNKAENDLLQNSDISIEERKKWMKYTFYLNFQEMYIYGYPIFNFSYWLGIPIKTKDGITTYEVRAKNIYDNSSYPCIIRENGDTLRLKNIMGSPYMEFEAPSNEGYFEVHTAYPFGSQTFPLILESH